MKTGSKYSPEFRERAVRMVFEHQGVEWIDWFNHRRLLTSIGNLPPAEVELRYDRQRQESATVA